MIRKFFKITPIYKSQFQIRHVTIIPNGIYSEETTNKEVLKYTTASKTKITRKGVNQKEVKILQILDFGILPSVHVSYNIYDSVTTGIDYKFILKTLRLPDNVVSWYFIMAIHIWLVVLSHGIRPMTSYILSRRVSSLFMADVMKRCSLYHPTAPNISVTVFQKHIMAHYKSFAHDLDKAASISDLHMAEVLYVYSRQSDYELDFNSILLLVNYIRKQLKELEESDVNDLLYGGNISWSPFEDRIKIDATLLAKM